MKKIFTGVTFCLLGISAQAQVVLKDIAQDGSSDPSQLTNVNGTLYFRADDWVHGLELWKSDGTEAGTMMVKDIYPGPIYSMDDFFSSEFTDVNGNLFFLADDGVHGTELWKSNGTAAGTMMVKDINVGEGTSRASGGDGPQYTNVNGTLFFRAQTATGGDELWKSDGTAAGTMMVKDIAPVFSSYPGALTAVGSTLYFSATDESKGHELWKSDGTAAGTVMVKDVVVGGGNSTPSFMRDVNGTLFYTAYTSATGRELWKSDGTAAGTVMIKDINPGSGNSFQYTNINSLLNINGTLYFSADDGVHGIELWKTDGTAAGTVMIKDIRPGLEGGLNLSNIKNFTEINGELFFYADNGTHGREIWKSDGTEAGTVMVKDIYTGTYSAQPEQLINFRNTLFFVAKDASGFHLWKSDGTEAGTVIVNSDIVPRRMRVVNNILFMTASTSETGLEVYKYTGSGTPTGLIEAKYSNTLRIHPNPTSGKAYLDIEKPSRVSISDLKGVEVWSGYVENKQQAIDISKLAKGIYLVKLLDSAQTCKLIKD